MIYPKNNKLIHWFFHHYIGYIIRRNFKNFNFNRVNVSSEKSVLLLANHFGWWDGFILYWLNYLTFKKRFHIMILEDTVRSVFFLKYMGAFSIVKGSRETVSSLQYASSLLNDPRNLVLIFPQGKLYSNFTSKVIFERGLIKVTQPAAGRFDCLMAATFIENFQHKKPSVYMYLKKSDDEFSTADELQSIYQQHYDWAKLQQTKIVL